METKIVSGRVIEIIRARRVVDDADLSKRRNRKANPSSAAKMERNERDAVRSLARLINCNFGRGDLWVVLNFDNEHLPEDEAGCKKEVGKLLRKLRKAEGFKYIYAVGSRNPRNGEKVRYHIHMILPKSCQDAVDELWTLGNVSIRHLDRRGDYTGVARYIIDNATTGEKGGKKRYSPSKGLEKPIYFEPVECKITDRVRIPRSASIGEQQRITDNETGNQSYYLRYTTMPGEKDVKYRRVRWDE